MSNGADVPTWLLLVLLQAGFEGCAHLRHAGLAPAFDACVAIKFKASCIMPCSACCMHVACAIVHGGLRCSAAY
jgi:hypothetical protein